MATAYEQKQREQNLVTQKRIEEAKAEAMRLFALAYEAQPVKQPDGTVRMLCYAGRINRAHQVLALERKRNGANVTVIENAVKQLTALGDKAMKEADAAISRYAALAASAGQESEQFELVCQCEGCVEGRRLDAMWEAEAKMREKVWSLLIPEIDNDYALPAIVQRDDTLLDAAIEAIKAFVEAAKAANVRPDWRDVLNFVAW